MDALTQALISRPAAVAQAVDEKLAVSGANDKIIQAILLHELGMGPVPVVEYSEFREAVVAAARETANNNEEQINAELSQ